MPPSGPRSRPSQPAGRGPPPPHVRNEVFENIFGRPAGGHHLGPAPPSVGGVPSSVPNNVPAPPGQRSPYPSQPAYPPAQQRFNPAQPSYPPAQVYPAPPQPGPPPQRTTPYPVQPAFPTPAPVPHPSYDSSNSFPRPQISNYASPSQQQPVDPLPDRRASLAPSVYSNSSGSVYSPNPNAPSPPMPPSNGRLPSGSYPSNGYPSRTSGTNRSASDRVPHMTGLSTSDSFTQVPVSSKSVVAPPRSGSLIATSGGPSKGRTSIPSSSTTSPTASIGSSFAAAPLSPTDARSIHGSDRTMSPPPDYLRSMNALTLNSGRSTPGPLDDIPGIPEQSTGDLGLLDGPWSVSTERNNYRSPSEPPARRPMDTRQVSASSISVRSMHTRMPSDSSVASSIYTVAGQRMTPLSQIDNTPSTMAGPLDSPLGSPLTPTGSDNGLSSHAQHRKSVESTQSLPLLSSQELPPGAANSVYDHRAMSFSGGSVNRREIVTAVRSGSVGHGSSRTLVGAQGISPSVTSQRSLNRNTSLARQAALRSMPHIYPALLSSVAEAFRQLIELSELVKDGITYKDSFEGRTAVSIIADVIKTPDRNLALLLGRALDSQKFFHDVTYAHRLRDTPNEVYQFKERLVAPFMTESGLMDSPSSDHLGLIRPSSSSSGGVLQRPPTRPHTSDSSSIPTSDSTVSFFAPISSSSTIPGSPQLVTKFSSSGVPIIGEADEADDDDLPVGVFTLLTDCYSPTCTREQLCYSINCPRRLEQMKRLNMKPQPGLSRKLSQESLHDDIKETGTLWIHSVSQDVLDSVDDTEKKRQEAINEVIYTERDFVRDLEYLRDSWIKPLRTQEVISSSRREDFVRQVFWNVHDVLTVNHVLGDRLTKRQKQQPVVQSIGDIFLERVPHFEPFVVYGAHQLFGKYEFEKEKGSNPAFQKFVDETERKPESRKLELNGYLTKPTTRLGRYPLLLEAVLKYTPDGHSDKRDLPEVIKMVRALLTKVNEESGKSENIFELAQLEQQLVFRPSENIDLRLRDKNRELVHKGPMKRRGGNQGDNADLLAFLFDHAFLLVKSKWINKSTEQYKVYRRPIPLELLVLITPEDPYNSAKLSASRNKLIPRTATGKAIALAHVPPKPESKHGFSMTVIHLGRKGYSLQLWVDTYVGRKKWVESIDKQQQIIRDRSTIFVTETISEGYFHGLRRINCISPYDNGNRMIYGTDEGVYFSNLRDPKLREPVKVINLVDVTQVDVIEEFQLLIVLHERSVTTFPLDCLDPNDPNAALKRGKRISSHTSFFKSGICLGRTLIAVVKSSPLSSTIKVLEPIDQNMRGKKPQTSFMKRLNGGQDTLKVFKEFYIPLESFSVYFLKTKLCVGCQKGFEIVDLETLDMQSLLDPSDASLDFVLKRDGVRPMAIYRIEGDFLLCYDEFAFYVNKNGWRARPKWAIIWEGSPSSFALQYPYVIAFEPTFVEVRHVETGHLVQIIPGNNIGCLFADMPPSTVNAPPPPASRQLMYPSPGGQAGGMYRPAAPGQFPQSQFGQYGYGGGVHGVPPPRGAPVPGPYGMPPPMAMRNFALRPQVIFTSDDGHVQFLKLPLPPAKGRHFSESPSTQNSR